MFIDLSNGLLMILLVTITEHLKEDPQGSELKKKSLPRQVDFAVGQVTFHVHFPMGKSQARHLPTIL